MSFPTADRCEYRYLASICLSKFAGQGMQVVQGMTLRAEQLTSSPYKGFPVQAGTWLALNFIVHCRWDKITLFLSID